MAKPKATLEPKSQKCALTKFRIDGAPKALAGQRYEYLDTDCRGLALRVTDKGSKSFVFRARYPGKGARLVYARRALGTYPEMTLEEARDEADAWRKMLKKGLDPRRVERKQREAAQLEAGTTFGGVAGDFITEYAPRLAKAKQAKAIIEAEFVKRWKDWPIVDIGPVQCEEAIKAIKARGAPYQAHNAYGYLRLLFNWAISTPKYGVKELPLERLRPVRIIGERAPRTRILPHVELRRVWRAAYALGYPYCPIVHLLILTGARLNEVAGALWSEIDLDERLWTIPAERMKSDRPHEIPLTEAAVAIFAALPEWKGGPYVFSTTAGKKPVNGFSKVKRRLDALVADVAEHDGVSEEMGHWVLHDLRRTMRTRLSGLAIEDIVRELMIAHTQGGLHAVYDQHRYRDEKREGFELWEARLATVLAPPVPRGENVVTFARATA